jgi:hypothetical protein
MNILGFRLVITRDRPAPRIVTVRAWRPLLVALAVPASLVGISTGVHANISPTPCGASCGTATATVTTATRSLTVGLPTIAYSVCQVGSPAVSTNGVLQFPNGVCNVPAQTLTVTNGAAQSHIWIQGADMVPQDNGINWQLCDPTATSTSTPACTGPSGGSGHLAGKDQYISQNNAYNQGPFLSNTPQCDVAWGSGCVAAPNATQYYNDYMYGPTQSTDNAGSFTTTISWVVLP